VLLWLHNHFPLGFTEEEPWIKSFKGDQEVAARDTAQLVGKQYLSFCPSTIFVKLAALEQTWPAEFPFAPRSPPKPTLWQIRSCLALSPFSLLTGELSHLSSSKARRCLEGGQGDNSLQQVKRNIGLTPVGGWPVEGPKDEQRSWDSAQGLAVQPLQDQVDVTEGKDLQLHRGKGSSRGSRGALTAVWVSSDAVTDAEALAAGRMFYMLWSRLAFPGRVG